MRPLSDTSGEFDIFAAVRRQNDAVKELQGMAVEAAKYPLEKVGRTLLFKESAAAGDVMLCVPIDGSTVPTMSGLGSGVYNEGSGETTVSLADPLFAAAVVGEDIVIDTVGTFTIVAWVSASAVTIAGDHAFSAKTVSLPDLPEHMNIGAAYVDEVDAQGAVRIPGRTRTGAGVYIPLMVRPAYTVADVSVGVTYPPWFLMEFQAAVYSGRRIVAVLAADSPANAIGDVWMSDSEPSDLAAVITAIDAFTYNYTADVAYAVGKTVSCHVALFSAENTDSNIGAYWPPPQVNDGTRIRLVGGAGGVSVPGQETFPPRVPLKLTGLTLAAALFPAPVADGTYNTGKVTPPGGTTGTITTVNGNITAVTQAT